MTPILKTEGLTHRYSVGTPFENTAIEAIDLEILPGSSYGKAQVSTTDANGNKTVLYDNDASTTNIPNGTPINVASTISVGDQLTLIIDMSAASVADKPVYLQKNTLLILWIKQ